MLNQLVEFLQNFIQVNDVSMKIMEFSEIGGLLASTNYLNQIN